MFAIVAAVLFALALLLDLADSSLGVIGVQTLTVAGLLCLALHLAGAGSWGRGRPWRGRRPGRG